MKRISPELDRDRRRFLRDMALAGGAATAAWAPAHAVDVAGAATVQPAASNHGYRVTAHVSKYYQTARF